MKTTLFFNDLLDGMVGYAGASLIFFDACRDNPFTPIWLGPMARARGLRASAPEWAAIQNTSSLAVLATFQERYPDPPWYDYAEARAQELRAADAARREAEAREDQAPKPASASPIAGPMVQTGEGNGGMKRPPNIWAGLGLIVIALGIGSVTPAWADKVKRPQQPEKSQAKSLEGPKASQPTRTASTSCAGVEVSLATGGTKCIKPGSGKSFKDCAECPEMVVVPAGRFMMGSSKEEIASRTKKYGDYFKDEGPQHEVVIPKALAVGKFEVTNAQFVAFLNSVGRRGPKDQPWVENRAELGSSQIGGRPGNFVVKAGKEQHAVVNVSWYDAQAYVKWLSAKTGKPYRLLSEAEWEYAARAGTTTAYPWGDKFDSSKVNNNASKEFPVGSFLPNSWGLYDMHGNVWEWVEDCWNESYEDKPESLKATGEAWTSGDCIFLRVLRGGSRGTRPEGLRSANRNRTWSVKRLSVLGFRLARTWADKVKRPQQPEKSQAKSLEGPKASQPTRTASTSCAGVKVSLGTGGTKCIKPGSGKSFKDCANCPEMVVVPAGKFLMGSPKDEEGRDNDEGPQHEVVIPKAFAVGKFEVTRGQFAAFIRARVHKPDGGCYVFSSKGGWKLDSSKSWRDPGFSQGDNHPVTCVSWKDAQAYAWWLSEKTGKHYRLLSEAEWEYAARGVTRASAPHKKYPWGDTASHEYANYGKDECCDGLAEGRDEWVYTAPVGKFPANAFGLHDMHGNVWEWVQDCDATSYEKAPVDGSVAPETCNWRRVVRGGSWGNDPGLLRSANRNGILPDDPLPQGGFRLARTLF